MPSLDPLVYPREYFSKVDPLSQGALLFLGYFVATILLFMVTLQLLLSRIENAPTGLTGQVFGQLLGVIFFTFIIMLIAWIVVAAVMHFVGGASGDGSFEDALGLAGFAYAPELLTMPIGMAFIWLETRDLRFDGSDPAEMARQVDELQAHAFGPGLLLTLLVTVWSVFILARGIQGTHDADSQSAWTAALIVGIGSILLTLLG